MRRSVQAVDVGQLHYASQDVLVDEEARITRMKELNSAMAVTNTEHEEIGLIVKLNTGERVEILSDLIDLEEDFVEVKGGHLIPIRAIVSVEI